jgi:peptidoglycan hydrolase-like protein with peptidoglycan-binding domain
MALPMPFPADRITGRYGDPRPNGRIHLGLDFWADRGTPILASGNGYVLRHGFSDLGGHILEVRYDNGEDWNYYHSDNRFPIADGTRVQEGTHLGGVGSYGAASTGPHVHVEVYLPPSPNAVNPEQRMDMSRSVGQSGGGGGDDVLQLQTDLQTLGYYLGELDSDYGPQTTTAVEDFQKVYNLQVDGDAGPTTKAWIKQVVTNLQNDLNKVGGYGLVVDGESGAKTIGALKDFQSKQGITADGICGPVTRQKLAAAIAGPQQPPVVIPKPDPAPVPNPGDAFRPALVTPTAADFALFFPWIEFDVQRSRKALTVDYVRNVQKYYGKPYNPTELHAHWWGTPRAAGTHQTNVDHLLDGDEVSTNFVASPKRVTLMIDIDLIALTTGQYNPIAWKVENDPIMTVPEGREWGYKTLAAIIYLVERKNPALRNQPVKLHKDYYATECSNIDRVEVRRVVEQFFSGALDTKTGLPPVSTPPVDPPVEPPVSGLDPNEFPLLVELKDELNKLHFKE